MGFTIRLSSSADHTPEDERRLRQIASKLGAYVESSGYPLNACHLYFADEKEQRHHALTPGETE